MKSNHPLFDLPWWSFLIVALIVFLFLRYGMPAFMLNNSSPFTTGLSGVLGHLAWFASAPWVLVAILFFFRHRHRKELLDRQQDIQSIRELSWQEFEMVCGEMFRRQGFSVAETGLNGPDGGVDLILRRGTETWLVQCKRWKTSKVGVREIRELYGLVAAHRATGGIFVTCGRYTRDAKAFAQSRQLDLIDGYRLAGLIQAARREQPAKTHTLMKTDTDIDKGDISTSSPSCPKCGASMVLRTAKRGQNRGREFWGCSTYPKCRGIVNI